MGMKKSGKGFVEPRVSAGGRGLHWGSPAPTVQSPGVPCGAVRAVSSPASAPGSQQSLVLGRVLPSLAHEGVNAVKTSPPPQKGFQGPNPITVTRTWGAVGRAAMQQTSAVCYLIFFPRTRQLLVELPESSPWAGGNPHSPGAAFLL